MARILPYFMVSVIVSVLEMELYIRLLACSYRALPCMARPLEMAVIMTVLARYTQSKPTARHTRIYTISQEFLIILRPSLTELVRGLVLLCRAARFMERQLTAACGAMARCSGS